MTPTTLLCTVGTSLFYPNLSRAAEAGAPALAEAFSARDWERVATLLQAYSPAERLCGAEINSIAAMEAQRLAAPDARLCFLCSDTPDGAGVGAVLAAYFRGRGRDATVETVPDLQDEDPARFAHEGLRNLARACCRLVRDYSAPATAINATGGYKAQVAIAVLLGQALGVPVYYKHERFDHIIAFPPMPVALDFDYWMEVSGILADLARDAAEPPSWDDFEIENPDRLAALVDAVEVDGRTLLALSPTGQIFHEAFRERFRLRMDQLLPPAVPEAEKREPLWEDSGNIRKHDEVMRFMQRLTREVPQVRRCHTYYYNPRLPRRTHARLGAQGLEALLSNGAYTAKIRIESTAATPLERQALAAHINAWIDQHWRG